MDENEERDLQRLMAYWSWSEKLLKDLEYWSIGRFVIQGRGSVGPTRLVIRMDDSYQSSLLARKLEKIRKGR